MYVNLIYLSQGKSRISDMMYLYEVGILPSPLSPPPSHTRTGKGRLTSNDGGQVGGNTFLRGGFRYIFT